MSLYDFSVEERKEFCKHFNVSKTKNQKFKFFLQRTFHKPINNLKNSDIISYIEANIIQNPNDPFIQEYEKELSACLTREIKIYTKFKAINLDKYPTDNSTEFDVILDEFKDLKESFDKAKINNFTFNELVKFTIPKDILKIDIDKDQYEKQLKKLKKQLESQKNEYEKNIEDLTKKNYEITSINNQLTDEITALTRKINELTTVHSDQYVIQNLQLKDENNKELKLSEILQLKGTESTEEIYEILNEQERIAIDISDVNRLQWILATKYLICELIGGK